MTIPLTPVGMRQSTSGQAGQSLEANAPCYNYVSSLDNI